MGESDMVAKLAAIGCVVSAAMWATGCETLSQRGLPQPIATVGSFDANDDAANSDDVADVTNNANDDPAGGASPDLFAVLADRFYTFGDASFFSGGSITENNELQLCAFGRFGMRVTSITSTSFDTFSSENLLLGTWRVEGGGAAATLLLIVEDATDAADVGTRQIAIAIDASGIVFFDGVQSEALDASADCASAQ